MRSEFWILICAIQGIIFWFWMQKVLKNSEKSLKDNFKAVSFDIMQKNTQSFLQLANIKMEEQAKSSEKDLQNKQTALKELLEPLKETLHKLDEQQRKIENKREGAYASLTKQIDNLLQSERFLFEKTHSLEKALKSPNVRGSWGEMHLKRVVELAGLLNHCDFFEQLTQEKDGRISRPDLVVRLPNNRSIIVDAKTPIEAYFEAMEAKEVQKRDERLKHHAIHIRKHIKDLSSKQYWKQFDKSVEYVVLFLPSEAFFSAAVQVDPALIELGASQNVMIATPTTLIAILKAIAFGWKQDKIKESSEKIALLGRELYDRLMKMNLSFSKVGKSLSHAVDQYNQTLTTFEKRVMVSARKFNEMGVSQKSDEKLQTIEEVSNHIKNQYIEDTCIDDQSD